MNAAQKILLIMGIFYVVIGGTIALAFLGFGGAVGLNAGGFIAIPLLFVVLGKIVPLHCSISYYLQVLVAVPSSLVKLSPLSQS